MHGLDQAREFHAQRIGGFLAARIAVERKDDFR